jgi:hypothetical protein
MLGAAGVGIYVVLANANKIGSFLGAGAGTLISGVAGGVSAGIGDLYPNLVPAPNGTTGAGTGTTTSPQAAMQGVVNSQGGLNWLLSPGLAGLNSLAAVNTYLQSLNTLPASPSANQSISTALNSLNIAPVSAAATSGSTPSASAALWNVPGNVTNSAANFNPNDVTPWAQPGSPAWNAARGIPG